MPEDTLFPSLDGEAPGEVEESEDITGQRLPPLVEKEGPFSEFNKAINQGVSNIPSSAEPMEVLETTDEGAKIIEGPEPKKSKPRRNIQERINQLTNRYHQAEDANQRLTDQLTNLQQQVLEQQKALSFFLQREPQTGSTPPQEAYGDMLSSTPAGAEERPMQRPAQGQPSLEDLRRVVREEVEPLRRKQEATDQEKQLWNSHNQSFARASEEMPELMDGNSAARRIFNEIYNRSPLRTLPDAPEQIMMQVKGLLAEEEFARAPITPEARKRAAVVHTPAPSTTDTGAGSDQRLQKVLNEARRRWRIGEADFDTYKAYRIALRKGTKNAEAR